MPGLRHVLAQILAPVLITACAHTHTEPLPPAPPSTSSIEERTRYYEAHRPLSQPAPALFFAAPMRLADGAKVEPGDLVAAVDDDSATAAAARNYGALETVFLSVFAGAAALELVSTASTLIGVPLLVRDPKAGLTVLVVGRIVEVAGFVVAAADVALKAPIEAARADAFAAYDADLRARLGLSSSSE